MSHLILKQIHIFLRRRCGDLTVLCIAVIVVSTPTFAINISQSDLFVETNSYNTYNEREILTEADTAFSNTVKNMADAVHAIFQKYGEPNAFIKGEEASGAIVFGLRYGSGTLHMKSGIQRKVFWQGPTVGWDFGSHAVKVFTLIYNLPNGQAIYQRFPSVEGSVYLIAGIGVNYQQYGNIIIMPMRSGVGLRFGASVGYLKYTKNREWLPF
jgi:hypothetical protein